MKNKNVIITGGAGGIGLAIARVFAGQGAHVALIDLKPESLLSAEKQLAEENFTVRGFACDITSEQQVIELMNVIRQSMGPVDILVNNAGLQYVSPIDSFPVEKFRYMLDVMLVAPFILMKQVIPEMKQRRCGRIINMASINGLVGFAGKSAYNSAKHGIIGLTKVAALETAEFGITVNAICPGYVDTPLVRNQLSDLAAMKNVPLERVMEEVIFPMVPQKRLLDPSEIAEYILFLAGDKAAGITGQAVVIDGGYTVG